MLQHHCLSLENVHGGGGLEMIGDNFGVSLEGGSDFSRASRNYLDIPRV